jgi:hypothetical protein
LFIAADHCSLTENLDVRQASLNAARAYGSVQVDELHLFNFKVELKQFLLLTPDS